MVVPAKAGTYAEYPKFDSGKAKVIFESTISVIQHGFPPARERRAEAQTQSPCTFHGHFPYCEIEYRILKNALSTGRIVGLLPGIVFSPPNVHEAIKVGWGTKLKET